MATVNQLRGRLEQVERWYRRDLPELRQAQRAQVGIKLPMPSPEFMRAVLKTLAESGAFVSPPTRNTLFCTLQRVLFPNEGDTTNDERDEQHG